MLENMLDSMTSVSKQSKHGKCVLGKQIKTRHDRERINHCNVHHSALENMVEKYVTVISRYQGNQGLGASDHTEVLQVSKRQHKKTSVPITHTIHNTAQAQPLGLP